MNLPYCRAFDLDQEQINIGWTFGQNGHKQQYRMHFTEVHWNNKWYKLL